MKAVRLVAALLLAAMLCAPALAAPKLSSPRVTPTAGAAGELYTFTVSYSGEQPESVKLFINRTDTVTSHELLEVDSTDINTTDGKDYFIRLRLEEGVSVFYFKATLASGEEARTAAATIHVRPSSGIRMDHLDVVFAVLVFLIPTAWGLLIFRRLSRDIRNVLDSLRKRGDDGDASE